MPKIFIAEDYAPVRKIIVDYITRRYPQIQVEAFESCEEAFVRMKDEKEAQSLAGAELVLVIRMQVDRQVMDVHADAFRPQGTEDRRAVRGQGVEFQADHVKMIGMGNIAADGQRLHGRQLRRKASSYCRAMACRRATEAGSLANCVMPKAHWMSESR